MTDFMPKYQAPVVDKQGRITPTWRDYLMRLTGASSLAEVWAAIDDIRRQIADEGAGSFLPSTSNVLGLSSVRTYGELRTGNVTVQLDGDQNAPGPNRYYGTSEDGLRGYYERRLDTLADVDATTPPAEGDVLRHNGTAWAPRALALDDLSDVSAPSPTSGQVLVYDGSEWAPATNTSTGFFNYISADGDVYVTEDGADLYVGV